MEPFMKWLKITNQFQSNNEDEKPSHLLLNGYKLYVKPENIQIFNKKYAEGIINKEKLYVVECKKNIFNLFFDLDFLLTEEQYRNYNGNENGNEDGSSNIFIEIIKIINEVIYEFYEKYFDCIVTTADIKKVKKYVKMKIILKILIRLN